MSSESRPRIARSFRQARKMSRRRWLIGIGASAAAALVAACRQAPPLRTAASPTATAAKPSGAAAPGGTVTAGSVRRALVLGGGAATGRAWEVGVIKGLKDAGVDVTQADLMVGTSSGAVVATRIRSGAVIDNMFAAQLAPLATAAPGASTDPGFDQDYVRQSSQMIANAPELTPALRIQIGKRALAATRVISEDAEVKQTAQSFGNIQDWPSRPLRIAAGDVTDGTIRFFDKTQGVPIVRALAATGAVPGMVAPITIGDRRYMDGFVGGVNLDGAAGASIVLVLSLGSVSPEELKREIDLARSRGSQVLNVSPDADARAAMGPNAFDLTRLAPTAQAAARQAETIVAQVRTFWEGNG